MILESSRHNTYILIFKANSITQYKRVKGIVEWFYGTGLEYFFPCTSYSLNYPITRKVNMLKGWYIAYLNRSQWKDNNKTERSVSNFKPNFDKKFEYCEELPGKKF